MSPVGAIFVPFPLKTGTKLFHPRPPPQSLNGSNSNRSVRICDTYDNTTSEKGDFRLGWGVTQSGQGDRFQTIDDDSHVPQVSPEVTYDCYSNRGKAM